MKKELRRRRGTATCHKGSDRFVVRFIINNVNGQTILNTKCHNILPISVEYFKKEAHLSPPSPPTLIYLTTRTQTHFSLNKKKKLVLI